MRTFWGYGVRQSNLPSSDATAETRLTALYRAYGAMIYARCRRLLGDGAAAEDATQETFMRVHRHLDKADQREALAWIYRIATNYCLNEIRNRRRRPEPREIPPEVPTGGDVATLLADRDLAERIVEHAPEKLRVAAWLHYVDGLDQSEVARVLGISRRTVVTRCAEFADNARKYLERMAA